ncbi:MAG: phospholipid carrier-dependent glycosyltransferase, partial [Myxococcales bacterium]|nr:phospholipid carrier-dependent glycosyltransferase [Myxococcales bacterium]
MSGRRTSALIALALALVTVALLSVGHRQVGYVRDEGIYFVAGRTHARWLAEVARAPSKLADRPARDRAFAINHEHPALLKLLAGAAGRLLSQETGSNDGDPSVRGLAPVLPEGAAMRLPAQLLSGLAVALLFGAGRALGGGALAGLLAAGFYILLPRVWFHAGLHCFDAPIAAVTLAVVLAYRRALTSWRWGLALGPIVGLAISIKHNALFLPLLLGLHYLCCLGARWWRGRGRPRPGQLAPLWIASVAVLAPLTFYALWPWLWPAPIERLTEYFEFHLYHSWYNTEYLGVNYNRPPMPVSLPLVMTWATVPTALLMLAGCGLVIGLRDDARRSGGEGDAASDAPRFGAPLPRPGDRLDGLLLAIFAVFPIALISLPSVPIFGGTKHWITAYPFLALLAALAWGRLWQAVGISARGRRLQAVALVFVLTPSAWATLRGHPYNLSQYAPLVGG